MKNLDQRHSSWDSLERKTVISRPRDSLIRRTQAPGFPRRILAIKRLEGARIAALNPFPQLVVVSHVHSSYCYSRKTDEMFIKLPKSSRGTKTYTNLLATSPTKRTERRPLGAESWELRNDRQSWMTENPAELAARVSRSSAQMKVLLDGRSPHQTRDAASCRLSAALRAYLSRIASARVRT